MPFHQPGRLFLNAKYWIFWVTVKDSFPTVCCSFILPALVHAALSVAMASSLTLEAQFKCLAS